MPIDQGNYRPHRFRDKAFPTFYLQKACHPPQKQIRIHVTPPVNTWKLEVSLKVPSPRRAPPSAATHIVITDAASEFGTTWVAPGPISGLETIAETSATGTSALVQEKGKG